MEWWEIQLPAGRRRAKAGSTSYKLTILTLYFSWTLTLKQINLHFSQICSHFHSCQFSKWFYEGQRFSCKHDSVNCKSQPNANTAMFLEITWLPKILDEWLPSISSQLQSVINPHAANTKSWRAQPCITSTTNKGFLNLVAIWLPAGQQSQQRSSPTDTPWMSNKDQSHQTPLTFISPTFIFIQSNPAEEEPTVRLHCMRLHCQDTLPRSCLIWITANHSGKRGPGEEEGDLFKPDSRTTERRAREKKAGAEEHSGSSQLNEIIPTLLTDTHLKERKRGRGEEEKILNYGFQLQYWQDKNHQARIMGR